jgi:transposase InsO family protein
VIYDRGVDRPRSFRDDKQESIHGAQYTAICFTQRLVDAGARPSMGSLGDSYDNALAENFFPA